MRNNPSVRGTRGYTPRALAKLSPSAEGRIEALLREHEGQALEASIYARLIFVSVGAVLELVNSEGPLDLIPSATLITLGVALQLYCLRLVRARRRHLFVGRALCAFDCVILIVLPLFWYLSVGGEDVSPAFLLKNHQVPWIALMMVINTLALRPLYPQLVGWTSLLKGLAFAAYAYADARTHFEVTHVGHYLGDRVNPFNYLWQMAVILLLGVFLSRLAWWARQAIRSAAELEASNLIFQEEQARRIMEAKIGALAGLVAGIAHEINTPLGALQSAANTAARSGAKVAEAVEAAESLEALRADRRLKKGLVALEQTLTSITPAAGRISELVTSLKDFSRLDQSEEVEADLRTGLDSTLSLVDTDKLGGIEVVRDYAEDVVVPCKARAINQVFMTVIDNALVAMEGQGTLTLRAVRDDGHVIVEIEDTGPGMDAAQCETLFDVALINRADRVAVRLGLPAARLIVDEHHGEISVHSVVGEGTRVRIALPVSADGDA